MQTERNRTCSKLLRCSLSYAKIMQTERNRACSKLLRCSLSYAKIIKKLKEPNVLTLFLWNNVNN